jgi:hypothetical protein
MERAAELNALKARRIMKSHCLRCAELSALAWPLSLNLVAEPEVPFSSETLVRCARSHLLVFTPATYANGERITLNSLRDRFGFDPARFEPCFYNQDWYLKEKFAAVDALDGKWHLLQKDVLEDARSKLPEQIESALRKEESFPTAVTCAFVFFAWWYHADGQRLWNHDFVWCSDRDQNGDRIYVGRYTDPTGVNRNGFNVHRHLVLRSAYSAAPEMHAHH